MIAIMVLVMIVGTSMDMTPTILILSPVLMPLIKAAGIDPVYFGVLFMMNNAIGLITPPVGVVLNTVAGAGRLSMDAVTAGVVPVHDRGVRDHVRAGPVPEAGPCSGALVLLSDEASSRRAKLRFLLAHSLPMIKIRNLLAAAASVFAAAAAAQAVPQTGHDGKWLATILTADGSRQSARFVLQDFDGQWIGAAGRKAATGSACAGKKLPITVQESTATALDFTVWATQLSPKCANLTIETKPVGKGVFEGTVASVGTIRMTRR